MTATGNLLKLSRDVQATALVGENLKKAKKKKLKTKDIVKLGTKNMVGINLLKVQAQLSSGL